MKLSFINQKASSSHSPSSTFRTNGSYAITTIQTSFIGLSKPNQPNPCVNRQPLRSSIASPFGEIHVRSRTTNRSIHKTPPPKQRWKGSDWAQLWRNSKKIQVFIANLRTRSKRAKERHIGCPIFSSMNVTGLSSVRFMYWGLDYVHGARCQMVRDQVVKFWCLPPNNRGLLGYIHHEEIQN